MRRQQLAYPDKLIFRMQYICTIRPIIALAGIKIGERPQCRSRSWRETVAARDFSSRQRIEQFDYAAAVIRFEPAFQPLIARLCEDLGVPRCGLWRGTFTVRSAHSSDHQPMRPRYSMSNAVCFKCNPENVLAPNDGQSRSVSTK